MVIHMKSVVNFDKERTLCGLPISKTTITVPNPNGEKEVTCGNCLKIIKHYNGD